MNQKLVLIGGGHSHAIALKQWGLNPLPEVDLTLISDVEQTPYSGMLPGHVAGFYNYRETHIDLRHLAQFAGAKLIIDRAIDLDLEQRQVTCHCHQVEYDYLSIDIGSTPKTISVPGAKKYAIPAKPVPVFLEAWYKLKQEAISHRARRSAASPGDLLPRVESTSPSFPGLKSQGTADREQPLSLVIVGGGAGGVELALNMQACLQKRLKNQGKDCLEIHLIHRGDKLLSGHNNWTSNKLEQIMRQRNIQLHLQESVVEVLPDRVNCHSGAGIKYSHVFWVTQATAPDWVKKSKLGTDEQGFILVGDTLQSLTHPRVFAAGDIATMTNHQRPKAGVFAVRQGQPLVKNWRNILAKKPLQPYVPQNKYLALIGTGDLQAIASWGNLGWRSRFLWQLKDYIDNKFMNMFVDLN